jgi:hypothetical protein
MSQSNERDLQLRKRGHDVVAMDLPRDDDSAGLAEYADTVICVGQQPLERGVLPLQVLEPFGVAGVHPAELVAPPVVRLLGTCSSGQTSATSLPAFSIRSAVASLRTTCSGVCFFLVAMLMSSLPAHNVGRKTLKRPGSTSRGQATCDRNRSAIPR